MIAFLGSLKTLGSQTHLDNFDKLGLFDQVLNLE